MLNIDKKIILLFTGRMVQVLFAVLTIRLMTELLSPQEVGHQYLILSIAIWFNLVLINPVTMFVNRHLHEWKAKGQLYFFIKQINYYFLLIGLGSAPLLFFIKNYFQVGTGLSDYETMTFVLCYVYFSTWFVTLTSFFNLFEQQKIFVSLNVLSQFLGLLFSVLFVKYVNSTGLVWLAGLLAGQVIAFLVAVIVFYKKFSFVEFNRFSDTEGIFKKETFKFCYPIAITTFFMWFINQGYRLVIEKNMGPEYLASLGVGLGLALSLAGVVETITTQYFYPKYYAALPNSNLEQRRKAWGELFKITAVIYIPASFLIAALSHLVIRVLTAEAFRHVGVFVISGSVIELLRQLSNIAYLVPHGEKKTYYTIAPYTLGALVLMACLSFFIFRAQFSSGMILLSLMLAGTLTYVCNILIVRKLLNISFEYRKIVKAVFISLPLVWPASVLSAGDSLMLLGGAGLCCTAWFFATIFYLVKEK